MFNMGLEIEKTHYFTLEDGTNIPVAKLPDNIKEQVKIYDEIRDNLVKKSFEAQVYQLAGEQKKLQLMKLLQEHIRKNYDSGNSEEDQS